MVNIWMDILVKHGLMIMDGLKMMDEFLDRWIG